MRMTPPAALTLSGLAIVLLAAPVLAQQSGSGDPNGKPPDGTVVATEPGGPGGQSSDQDASAWGCPPGGPPVWVSEGIDAELAAARRRPVGSHGGLYADDLANEVLYAGLPWYMCNTNQGFPIFDYPVPPGTPALRFEDLIARPDPQLHPDNDHVVVGVPVWLTLENGGVQQLQLPAAVGEFRAVPERVAWKTGVGNTEVICLDVTRGRSVVKDLDPPTDPRAEPPSDACTYDYRQPSTRVNAGGDSAYELIVEITYRIERRPAGSNGPWAVYAPDPVAIQTSAPELVRVGELQAVAAGG